MSIRFGASPSPAKAGFSLVEVLVAAFLGSLVLYVILTLLIPALKMSALGTTKVDLDGRASMTEQRIIRALRASPRAGVMAHHEPARPAPPVIQLLSSHPLEGTIADSKQKWAQYLNVFHWQGRTLTESRVPLAEMPVKATVLPLDPLLAALADDATERRFVIDDVVNFTVTVGEGPRVDFSVTLEKDKDKLVIERTVFLVNSSQ